MTHSTTATPASAPRWGLTGLALSMLLSSLGTSIANVGLPTFAQAFDATFQEVQWVILAYLLAITTLVVGVGRLADRLGRRRLLESGILLFTLASVLCAFAPALWLLVAARAVQGMGAAVMMTLTLAFVGETVPKEKTGSAMGLLATMSAVGTALGPTLGGALIAGAGWPALFLANVPLGILALLLVQRHLPADLPASKTDRGAFDFAGLALLAFTLGAYALAMTLGRGHFGMINGALLSGAVIGAGLFVRTERKAALPLVRLATLREPVLGAGFAMGALATTVVMATLVVGPFHLSGALGLDAARVGLVMSAGPVVAALAGVPAGRVVDRFGTHPTVLAGLIAMAAGSCAMALLPIGFGVAGYVFPLVVITAGYALFQAANNTAVMTSSGPAQRAVTSGLLTLSRNLGLVTGASVMGAVFAMGATATDLPAAGPAAVASGTRATFAVAAVLVVLALAVGVRSRAASRGGA